MIAEGWLCDAFRIDPCHARGAAGVIQKIRGLRALPPDLVDVLALRSGIPHVVVHCAGWLLLCADLSRARGARKIRVL